MHMKGIKLSGNLPPKVIRYQLALHFWVCEGNIVMVYAGIMHELKILKRLAIEGHVNKLKCSYWRRIKLR